MLRLKLALAQLYLYQEHIYKACDVLLSLGDLSYSPGVVRFFLAACDFSADHANTLRSRWQIIYQYV